ncbi:MAG: hypothetical protein GQ569_14625 [Methylococcaceae bacterium]|nr:hypothetical protein [Methylococcaceae bacterium]
MLNKITFLLLFLFSLSCYAANTVMEIIPLHNRPASEIHPIIAPLLDSSDSIIPNGFNLIIKTTPTKLREIKALIKQLDSALNNLSITVIQSKDISAAQLNAGIDVDINIPLNKPSDTQGQINARFRQKKSQRSRHNEQVLRTLEGTLAYIKTGSNHPVQSTRIYNSGYGQHTVTRQTQFIEATTGFAVLPRLNGDQVMLEISPWSDNMRHSGRIETQGARTTIRTRLGTWVEIGGGK